MALTKHGKLIETHYCFWIENGPSRMELVIASGYPKVLDQEKVWFTVKPSTATDEKQEMIGLQCAKCSRVFLKDIRIATIKGDYFEIEAIVFHEEAPALYRQAYIEVNAHRRNGSIYIERW